MSSFQFSLQFPSECGEFRIYRVRALAVLKPLRDVVTVGRTAGDETHSERISEAAIDGSRSRCFPEPVRKDTCGLNRDNTSVGGGEKNNNTPARIEP